MKIKLIILTILFFPIAVSGQAIQKDTDECKLKIPYFKGILEILNDTVNRNSATKIHFRKNFQNPENAAQGIIQEKGRVRFIINPDGTLSDYTIIKSAGTELDKEFIWFIKIIDKMAKPDSGIKRPVEIGNDILPLPSQIPDDAIIQRY